MSGIASIGSMSEYLPDRDNLEQRKIDSVDKDAKDDSPAPYVRAADAQLSEKTTLQGFQYTGKGSFIDKIF